MRGAIINLSAWLILPFMDAIAKYLSYSLPVLQVTWFRFFFSTLITLLFIFIFSRNSLVSSKNLKSQIIRGLLLLTSSVLFFYSISLISLAKALTIAFICPLMVTALSPFFLNEKVGLRRWTAVSIGFIGTLIVIRPGFIEINLATLAALGNGICYGFYLIITRKLSTSDTVSYTHLTLPTIYSV